MRFARRADQDTCSAKLACGGKRRLVDLLLSRFPPHTCYVEVFAGGADQQLVAEMKRNFATVKHAKPPSSRKGSVEWFVVAQGFKGRPAE